MTTRLQLWAITGGTVELGYSDHEEGRTWWVDQRNAWGGLESCEPFSRENDARLHALKVVDRDGVDTLLQKSEISVI